MAFSSALFFKKLIWILTKLDVEASVMAPLEEGNYEHQKK